MFISVIGEVQYKKSSKSIKQMKNESIMGSEQ